MNILGGLPAGKGAAGGGWAPLGGGGGASAQSFAGSDWPEPECCDPDDPFCDPWDDPMEMGQRKSAKSQSWCGGGGGGGGGSLCQQCMENETANCNAESRQCRLDAQWNFVGCTIACPVCLPLCLDILNRDLANCQADLQNCLKQVSGRCRNYCR